MKELLTVEHAEHHASAIMALIREIDTSLERKKKAFPPPPFLRILQDIMKFENKTKKGFNRRARREQNERAFNRGARRAPCKRDNGLDKRYVAGAQKRRLKTYPE
jgi:predicted RNase H-like nuclease